MRTGFIFSLAHLLECNFFWIVLQPLTVILTLFRHNPKWFVLAGYTAERAGNLKGAVNYFGKASDIARRSEIPEYLRWMHASEFFFEHALYSVGKSSVHDPLFECSVKETNKKIQSPGGLFKVEFVFSGLQIVGIVPASSGVVVEIYLDNKKIRNLNIIPGRFFRRFSFRFTRASIRAFPQNAILTMKIRKGKSLATLAGKDGLRLSIPHGYETGSPLMSGDRHVDKKGSLEPTDKELLENRNTFLDIYKDARDFFLNHFGKELFLSYGTLLGFVRQGNFIPGDDDFDTGLIADANNPESVKKETINMIKDLIADGFSVSFNRRGRLFRLYGRGQGSTGPHLDIHSFWVQDGKVWAHNDFCAPGIREQFVPAAEQDFGIFRAFIPAASEVFLSAHYGPDWRVPDPSFVNSFLDKNKKVLATLGEALITPAEFRVCRAEMKGISGWGEFVSLAERSLYPLPERDEDFE